MQKRERRWLWTIAAVVLVSIGALPAVLIYPLSVSQSRFMVIGGQALSDQWFRSIGTRYWLGALGTSMLLAATVAIGASLIAAPAAFYRRRWEESRLGSAIDAAAWILLVIPPISLAVGFFRVYGEGSIASLFLGHLVLAFPYAYLSFVLGFRTIELEVFDAAALSGASDWSTLVGVALPSSLRYVFLGVLLAFLTSWDETVLSVFLTGPTIVTLPRAAWETMQRERDLTVAAINVVIAPALALAVSRLALTGVPIARVEKGNA